MLECEQSAHEAGLCAKHAKVKTQENWHELRRAPGIVVFPSGQLQILDGLFGHPFGLSFDQDVIGGGALHDGGVLHGRVDAWV